MKNRIKELYEGKEGPLPGNNRWTWVANQINTEYDRDEPATSNSVRKLYGYHFKATVQKKIDRKVILDPRDDVEVKGKNALIIPDTHIPFAAPGFMEFCAKIRDRYKCDTIFHIGDVVDNHATGFWDSDPDGYSAGVELDKSRIELEKWTKEFPDVNVCLGNHDLRPARQLFKAGLPRKYLRGYNDIFGTPDTWAWNYSYDYHGVKVQHGNKGGKFASQNLARDTGHSVVSGHTHIYAGVTYLRKNHFAMQVGCGLDIRAYSFAYARAYTGDCMLGVGVLLESGALPIYIPF